MPPTIATAEPTVQVRLKTELASKLRVLAAGQRKTIGDVIESLAGKEIDDAYDAMMSATKAVRDTGNPVG